MIANIFISTKYGHNNINMFGIEMNWIGLDKVSMEINCDILVCESNK